MAEPLTALVLSGGGARGAYQVGVLRGLVDLGVLPAGPTTTPIVIGASAGALNAAAVACFADDVGRGVQVLEGMWGEVRPDRVFRTDPRSLGINGARWVRDLSFGGLLGRSAPKSLLDTAPLGGWLAEHLPLDRVRGHLASGVLRAFAVAATDLGSAEGVLFLDGGPGVRPWERSRWRIEPTHVAVPHLLASSAIPVLFPSVAIGGRHFGDGSIRNTSPLSPAIRLGAERIIAVGVRHATAGGHVRPGPEAAPTIAQVAATLLDAVMLDAVETDVAHSRRVNDGLAFLEAHADSSAPLRRVDVLWLTPSVAIRPLAQAHLAAIPPVVRYLLRGLGDDASVVELASYLLFDAVFCRQLMELGRADVRANAAAIRGFMGGK